MAYVGMYDSVTTSTVIDGLRPFTIFRFAVRSRAGSVVGPFGEEIRCRTAEGRKYWQHVMLVFSALALLQFTVSSVDVLPRDVKSREKVVSCNDFIPPISG